MPTHAMPTAIPAEYDAAHEGAVLIARDDRAFVRVFGREPVKMIHSLVTNDVEGAGPERATYALLLTPKGKMLADLRVVRRDDPSDPNAPNDDVLLDVPAGALDNVTTTLKKFVPPLFARFEVVDTVAELSVYGPRAAAFLGEALDGKPSLSEMAEDDIVQAPVTDLVQGAAPDDLAHGAGAREPVYAIRSLYTDAGGYDVIGASAAITALRDRLTAAGVMQVSDATLEVLRIEAGRPRWGAELDENVIPLEAGLEARAISQTKGCYTGQEVIVRILHRGHVNWLLRGVLADDTPPEPDATLLRPEDGRKVGRVTSACYSPRRGRAIGLAYTRRELEPPVTLKLGRMDGADVVVVDLPFAPSPLAEA